MQRKMTKKVIAVFTSAEIEWLIFKLGVKTLREAYYLAVIKEAWS